MMDHIRCPNGGKIAYGTRADAVQAKRRTDRNDLMHGRVPAQNLHVYECPHCHLWHFGHDRSAPRRREIAQ